MSDTSKHGTSQTTARPLGKERKQQHTQQITLIGSWAGHDSFTVKKSDWRGTTTLAHWHWDWATLMFGTQDVEEPTPPWKKCLLRFLPTYPHP